MSLSAAVEAINPRVFLQEEIKGLKTKTEVISNYKATLTSESQPTDNPESNNISLITATNPFKVEDYYN